MGAQGTATLDFGAFPGVSDASVNVTGQTGITGTSLVEAWLYPVATSDHTADEHMLETLRVVAGNIVAGTGFTIYGVNTSQLNEPLEYPRPDTFRQNASTIYGKGDRSVGGRGTRIYGTWTVAWVWN